MRFLIGCTVFLLVASLTAAVIWKSAELAGRQTPEQNWWLEARMADAIVARQDILLPARINEAVLRWSTAERLSAPPGVAIFGSSHTLQLSALMLRPHDVANFSISGGSLADHLITTQILQSRQIGPRVALVLVDPWYFDFDTDFLMWRGRPGVLAKMEAQLSQAETPELPPLFRERVERLSRPQIHTRYSIDPILLAGDNLLRRHFTRIVQTELADGLGNVLLADGSIHSAGQHREIDVAEARALAQRQFAQNRDRHRYGTFGAIDSTLWTLFERWIRHLGRNDTRVVLMMTPYHPSIYRRIVADPNNQLQRIEERVRAFAAEAKVPLVGSYNPEQLAVSEGDFFDGDHLREEGLVKLIGSTVDEAAQQAGVAPPAPAP